MAPQNKPALWSLKSFRLKISCLLCLGFFAINVSRTNMSVAIVCMVNSTAHDNIARSNKTVQPGCQLPQGVRSQYDGEFNWSSGDQGWVFAALFWGSLATTPIAGWLADRYGPKYLYVITASAIIVGSALTPITAHASVWALVPVRVLIGLGTGLVMPAASAMNAKWFPPFERGTAVAICTSGTQLASVIGNPVAAYLCSVKQFLGGWPSIFYICALLTGIFLLLWLLFATSTPDENRFISNSEKEYLQLANAKGRATESGKDGPKAIPWKYILLSPVSLVNFANNIANYTGMVFLQTYLPTYFKDVLLLDLSQNGLLSALPFILQLIIKFAVALVADWLKRSGRISPTPLSKISNSIAGFGAAVCLIGVSFMDCSTKMYAVALSSLATGFLGFHVAGYLTSLIVIAPAYAGVISSCAYAFAIGTLAVMPYVIGAITVNGTAGEWRIVFWIMIVILLSSAIMYIIWGSADLQSWAVPTTASDSKPIQTITGKENMSYRSSTETLPL